MKKLIFMFFAMFVFSFVSAQEETVVYEEPEEESEVQAEESKIQEEEAETEYETVKKKAEDAIAELDEETEPKIEAEPEEEPERVFSKERTKSVFVEPNNSVEFSFAEGKHNRRWSFLPINISLGTSIQVGFTVAQFTHKSFEIRIGNMMLGPGFRFGSKLKDDDGFVPGLTFLGEVGFGKFFGNSLKENCFGIMIGVGSKIIFDIRKLENRNIDDDLYSDDTLYVDFLPIYFTYRWHKNDKFYDVSLRIPLVWQNGVYVLTDETKLYNGIPDITLNFSFIF